MMNVRHPRESGASPERTHGSNLMWNLINPTQYPDSGAVWHLNGKSSRVSRYFIPVLRSLGIVQLYREFRFSMTLNIILRGQQCNYIPWNNVYKYNYKIITLLSSQYYIQCHRKPEF